MSKTTVLNTTKGDRQIPGEMMKYTATIPGLALTAVGVVGLGLSLYLFAVGNTGDGALSAAITVLFGTAAAVWLAVEHRREVHRRH